MIGTNISNLRDLMNQHEADGEFIVNPLDALETYTYTLEWFIVDRTGTRQFQIQEAFDATTIATDSWPKPDTNYVVLAKTGYTTEFNVTDLTVESVGVGNSNYSKIAGTADKLDFTVTQVGNTSLADTLQNAVALCGYTSISDASYFIKINFIGSQDSKTTKLSQTKVLPFKIRDYQNLSTSTDARGTTTVITGQVPADVVVMNAAVATTEYGFEYDTGATLTTALDNFFSSLNESIAMNNQELPASLKHYYYYRFSPQFKEWAGSSNMTGPNTDVKKSMVKEGKNNAIKIGDTLPGQHIYATLEEICSISDTVRDALLEDTATYTNVLAITPYAAIKENGYNPVKGTQSYQVEYYIDFTKKLVEQNMPDYFMKVKNSKALTKEIFDDGHVRKKYHYLFTGKNDQILDFNISLDAELTKVFTTPNESWTYDAFKQKTELGAKVTVEHQALIDLARADFEVASAVVTKQEDVVKDLVAERKVVVDEYKQKILAELGEMDEYKNVENLKEIINNSSWQEIMDDLAITEPDPKHGIFTKKIGRKVNGYNVYNAWKNVQKLDKAIAAAQKTLDKSQTSLDDLVSDNATLYSDIIAAGIINSPEFKYQDFATPVFENLRKNNPEKNKNIILAEELGSDFMSSLSNSDFATILRAQQQNPITFQRLVTKVDKGGISTQSSQTVKDLATAKEKYYEAKAGKLSMILASMTIKGDPYWIEGHEPPSAKKAKFGNKGSDRIALNTMTKINGFPHLILESGKATGTDINDNIITANMILSLYAVKSITSNFQNGLFTQTLSMVKNPSAEFFPDDEVMETTQEHTINPNEDTGGNDSTYTTSSGPDDGTRDDDESVYGPNGTNQPFMALGEQVVDFLLSPLNSTLDEKMEGAITHSENIDQDTKDTLAVSALNPTGDLGKHQAPLLDNMVRRNNALFYLENTKELRDACATGKSPSSCAQVIESENSLLATLGLSPDDKGKASTVTAVNDYFNGVIANPATETDFVLSEQEVAAYQIAVGGELNITGHDPADINKIVKKATGSNSANIIVDQIEAGTYYSKGAILAGAIVENSILAETTPLLNEVIVEERINVPEYTWEEQMYKDQINYPNSNNDWKNTHWFKAQVDEIVTEERVFNPETRRLEIVKIPADTLTVSEAADIEILSQGIDGIIKGTVDSFPTTWPMDRTGAVLKSKQQEWFDNSAKNLDKRLKEAGVTVTEAERTEMLEAISEKISKAHQVENLSASEFTTVEGYANAINVISSDSVSRNQLKKAVIVKKNSKKLDILVTDADTLKTKLDGYYPDSTVITSDKAKLQEVELQIAEVSLGLPDEVISAVRTITTGSKQELVQAKIPVSQIAVASQPVIVKTAALNTLNVILPSRRASDLPTLNVTTSEAQQYDEAQKIYRLIVSTDYGQMIEVKDDYSNANILVKDFNKIGPITYTDVNGTTQKIGDPSAFFGLYTNTYDDSNPGGGDDYTYLREKIAKFFPAIEVGPQSKQGAIWKTTGITRMIKINHDVFYIDKSSSGEI